MAALIIQHQPIVADRLIAVHLRRVYDLTLEPTQHPEATPHRDLTRLRDRVSQRGAPRPSTSLAEAEVRTSRAAADMADFQVGTVVAEEVTTAEELELSTTQNQTKIKHLI